MLLASEQVELEKAVGANYTFKVLMRKYSGSTYYRFVLLNKGLKVVWKIACSVNFQGDRARLGKLKEYSKGASFVKSQELDLLRFHAEKFLYDKGVRHVSGSTNYLMVRFMGKRGWKAEHDAPYSLIENSLIEKTLSPEANPAPLIYKRISRSKARKKPILRKPRARPRV